MREVDVCNLQHHLGSFLDQVEAGETLEIRRRHKVIARVVPCVTEAPSEPWPDILARLEALYPDGPVEPGASEILYENRNGR